jgi:hypothetical protein
MLSGAARLCRFIFAGDPISEPFLAGLKRPILGAGHHHKGQAFLL